MSMGQHPSPPAEAHDMARCMHAVPKCPRATRENVPKCPRMSRHVPDFAPAQNEPTAPTRSCARAANLIERIPRRQNLSHKRLSVLTPATTICLVFVRKRMAALSIAIGCRFEACL